MIVPTETMKHIIPDGELGIHNLSINCFCDPEVWEEDAYPGIVVRHRRMDDAEDSVEVEDSEGFEEIEEFDEDED
jgi:hypothetical protein